MCSLESNLGTILWPILDEFLENFRRGGGVISDPKKFVAKFLAFESPFWGVISVPKNFVAKNRYIFPKKGPGGGGQKAVWNFSENSSIMVGTGFP